MIRMHVTLSAMADVILVTDAQGRCLEIAPTNRSNLLFFMDYEIKLLHSLNRFSRTGLSICLPLTFLFVSPYITKLHSC